MAFSLKTAIENLWNDNAPWVVVIGIILAIIAAIVLMVAGYGFLTVVLASIVIGLALWKALPVIISSFFLAALIKMLAGTLKTLTAIWFAGTPHDQLYAFIDSTGYLTAVLLVFLVLYAIRYVVDGLVRVIGSFRPVYVNQHIGDHSE